MKRTLAGIFGKAFTAVFATVLTAALVLGFFTESVMSEAATGFIGQKLAAPKITRSLSDDKNAYIEWNAVSGADGYIIYKYNTSKKKYKSCGTVTGESSTCFRVSGLKSGKSYKFKVAAYVVRSGKKTAQTKSKVIKVKTAQGGEISYYGRATANANLRTGPGTGYEKVLQLTANEDVIITGEATTADKKIWYHILVTRDGTEYEGYATSSYVSKLEPITGESLPVGFEDFYVYDENGNTLYLSDCLGSPIIINIWATWCGPCVGELPEFENMYKKYGDDVRFIMINCENRSELANVKQFLKDRKYTFPVYYDFADSADAAYGTGYIPVTVAIDRKGKLIYHDSGSLTEKELKALIEKVME